MSDLSSVVPDGQLISSKERLIVRLSAGSSQVHCPPWHQVNASPTWTAISPTLPAVTARRSNLRRELPLRSSGVSRARPNQLPLTGVCTSRPAAPSVWKAVLGSTLPPPSALA